MNKVTMTLPERAAERIGTAPRGKIPMRPLKVTPRPMAWKTNYQKKIRFSEWTEVAEIPHMSSYPENEVYWRTHEEIWETARKNYKERRVERAALEKQEQKAQKQKTQQQEANLQRMWARRKRNGLLGSHPVLRSPPDYDA